MEEIWRKIWKVLAPKPRSLLRPNPRVSDGSYPVGNRWGGPYDAYERDREMYRRHQEDNFPRVKGKPTDDEENKVQEEVKQVEEKPDWKIRDEQYREDDERERRHQEGYWSKVEDSQNSSNDNSSSTDSSEQK